MASRIWTSRWKTPSWGSLAKSRSVTCLWRSSYLVPQLTLALLVRCGGQGRCCWATGWAKLATWHPKCTGGKRYQRAAQAELTRFAGGPLQGRYLVLRGHVVYDADRSAALPEARSHGSVVSRI